RTCRCAAVDLIGADMNEARKLSLARSFEKAHDPANVGAQEWQSVFNTAIDMSLRREIDSGIEADREQLGDGARIGDVASHETIASVVGEIAETFRISCVSELVEVHDLDVGPSGQHMTDEVRSNEAGAAGDQEFQDALLFASFRGISEKFAQSPREWR